MFLTLKKKVVEILKQIISFVTGVFLVSVIGVAQFLLFIASIVELCQYLRKIFLLCFHMMLIGHQTAVAHLKRMNST